MLWLYRFLFEQKESLGALVSKTARDLGWADKTVMAVRPDTAAVEAMARMAEKNFSSVAVVGDSGALIGNFSFSDLR